MARGSRWGAPTTARRRRGDRLRRAALSGLALGLTAVPLLPQQLSAPSARAPAPTAARAAGRDGVSLEARGPMGRALVRLSTPGGPARRRVEPRVVRYRPTGTLRRVPGSSSVHGSGVVYRFDVRVERGLGIDAAAFARRVEDTLFHRRGWTRGGGVAFKRVSRGRVAFHVSLASPSLTDRLCAPAATRGRFSCHNGGMVVINFWRWMHGSRSYGRDLVGYRHYVINHEVGHALGRGHLSCPGRNLRAPVMMQQTIGVGACDPHPWPRPYERG